MSEFSADDADQWFERNRDKMLANVANDPVLKAIEDIGLSPDSYVLEVGCSNGWRIAAIADKYKCACDGVDPSMIALEDGIKRYCDGPDITLNHGESHDLEFLDTQWDTIIYGFCLYLCDRKHLMTIVQQGDKMLVDGGHLIIYDFHSEDAHSRVYKHNPALRSYKMDHSKLWLANPAYSLVRRIINSDETSVTVLKKNLKDAFPLREE